MEVERLIRGSAFCIWALRTRGDDVQAFIQGLRGIDRKRISALLDYTAHYGIPRHPKHYRYLRDKIHELKASPRAPRLLFFRHGTSDIILTNGFLKKKSGPVPAQQLDRAKNRRAQFVEEVKNGRTQLARS